MTQLEMTPDKLINLLNEYGGIRPTGRAIGVPESTLRGWITQFGLVWGPDADKAIIKALREELGTPLVIPPTLPLKTQGEALNIGLADLHIGSIVCDAEGKQLYNKVIAKERMLSLCGKTLSLIKNHVNEGTKLTEMHLHLAGDLVDGEGIYPAQSFRIEMAPPEQVMLATKLVRDFIFSLSTMKIPLYIHAVKGNHGRVRKDFSPQSNWDLMVYMLLDDWIRTSKAKNIFMEYSVEDHLVYDVMGWKYLMRHRGPNQVETGSGSAKAGGWFSIHDADCLVYGHWHHPGLMEWNKKRLLMLPSLKGPDEFSESIAKGAEPAQCIWGTTRKHLTTFYYVVDLK